MDSPLTDTARNLMTMSLQSLRELVEIGSRADRVAAKPSSMRVSGGSFGPDRDLNERIAFYGMPTIVVDIIKRRR